ncbi:MAG: hypothetical protein WCQ47_05060 [bacterium]
MKKILFLILVVLSASAHAYYFTYPYGKGNLYSDASISIAKGTTESFNLYNQYGISDNLDINLWVPDLFYYDVQAKDGSVFYSNPTIGYFFSFINNDENKFGTFANFMLPFRAPRGLDVDMGVIYSRRLIEKWNIITGLDIPFSKYVENPANVTLTYIIGAEYAGANLFSQLAFNVSEQVKPDRAFGLGALWYVEYLTSVGAPYIELGYDAKPVENWYLQIGFYRIFNLL